MRKEGSDERPAPGLAFPLPHLSQGLLAGSGVDSPALLCLRTVFLLCNLQAPRGVRSGVWGGLCRHLLFPALHRGQAQVLPGLSPTLLGVVCSCCFCPVGVRGPTVHPGHSGGSTDHPFRGPWPAEVPGLLPGAALSYPCRVTTTALPGSRHLLGSSYQYLSFDCRGVSRLK